MGLRYHRHGLEVEAVEGFGWQQLCLDKMACEAAAVTLGDLVFGEQGEEAGRRPAFLVRPFGEAGSVLLDRGEAEFVENQGQPGVVDALGHVASPSLAPRSSS